jgi:hypothetical protein
MADKEVAAMWTVRLVAGPHWPEEPVKEGDDNDDGDQEHSQEDHPFARPSVPSIAVGVVRLLVHSASMHAQPVPSGVSAQASGRCRPSGVATGSRPG